MRARFPSLGSFKQIHCFTLPRLAVSEVCSWLAPRLFRGLFSLRFSRVLSVAWFFLVFWPFAPSGFHRLSSLLRPLLTSARTLARQISPEGVQCFDPCRRALPLAAFGDGWISCLLAHSSPASGLSARRAPPTIVSLLIASFSSVPRGPAPCFSLRLLSRLPVNSFHLTTLNPMSGTLSEASRFASSKTGANRDGSLTLPSVNTAPVDWRLRPGQAGLCCVSRLLPPRSPRLLPLIFAAREFNASVAHRT